MEYRPLRRLVRWLSGLLVLCLFLRLVSFVAIAASLVAPHFSWSFFQSANYTYVLIASGLASRLAYLRHSFTGQSGRHRWHARRLPRMLAD